MLQLKQQHFRTGAISPLFHDIFLPVVSFSCLVMDKIFSSSLNFVLEIQLTLFRLHLSRITAYLEVKILSLTKHKNLQTSKKKYCGKEEKLLPFSTIFLIYF